MRASVRNRLGLLLVLTPVALQVLVVRTLGVNTLVWDELFYVDFIRQVLAGERWLPWLLIQHNEHRVVPMKLTMAFLAPWTRWSTVAEMYCSAVLAGIVIWGLWRLYRQCGGTDLLSFAPAAWLVCSLAQFQNILFGMMMCHYFTLAGLVWALVFLCRPGAAALAAAVLCGVTAASSIANGLLVWPVGLALLLVRAAPRARVLCWAAAAAVTFGGYFYRFQLPPQVTPVSHDLRGLYLVASYSLAALGAPLGAGSMDWSRAMGLALSALIAALALRWWREGREARTVAAPLGALVLLGLLSCGMIAAGRAASGIQPFESRYIAYSSLAVIGAWLLLDLQGRRAAGGDARLRLQKTAAAALLIPGLLAANLWGFREARQWRTTRLHEKFLLQTAESQPDEALRTIYFLPEVRRMVPYLRAHRLGPFSEPRDILLPVRPQMGSVAGEILPGRPLEQRLVCPVDRLWEAGVIVAGFGRKNRSTLVVSLRDGGRELGRRVVQGESLNDDTWISIPLADPLPCQGRVLTVRFESPDAAPGNALSAWTYPRYYEGDLRQAGAPAAGMALDGRALGLELNAFHYGIMK